MENGDAVGRYALSHFHVLDMKSTDLCVFLSDSNESYVEWYLKGDLNEKYLITECTILQLWQSIEKY